MHTENIDGNNIYKINGGGKKVSKEELRDLQGKFGGKRIKTAQDDIKARSNGIVLGTSNDEKLLSILPKVGGRDNNTSSLVSSLLSLVAGEGGLGELFSGKTSPKGEVIYFDNFKRKKS